MTQALTVPRQKQYERDEKNTRAKETKLIIVVGLLAVAVIALIVTLTLQIAVFSKQEYKEMCQNEECIRTGELSNSHHPPPSHLPHSPITPHRSFIFITRPSDSA
jgi:flagellar basal body-associated protein FliL